MLKRQFLDYDRLSAASKTYEWFYSDTIERYNEVKNQVSVHPGDFVYKFNNFGFRCDDFTNWVNHPIRILFSGCSETEGVGIPLELSWAKVFHGMICNELKTSIPFWSIAHGGASLDHQVKHLYNEGDILRPQVIISYLPRFERRQRWSGDHWCAHNATVPDAKTLLREEYVRYQTEKNLCFINLLMNRWDSLFLYSKIDKDYDISYIDFPKFHAVDYCIDGSMDLGRDGWHFGPEANKIFAEQMFEYFWPIIKEKIGA